MNTEIFISDCPRCEDFHGAISFKPFARKTTIVHTHWAHCPRTKEPILARVTVTTEVE